MRNCLAAAESAAPGATNLLPLDLPDVSGSRATHVASREPLHNTRPGRLRGWLPILVLPWVVLAVFPDAWPKWTLMWALAFAVFAGCKWLTWRRTPAPAAPWWKHAGYLFTWPGMDAAAFLGTASHAPVLACGAREWGFALAKLAAGIILLWGIAPLVPPGVTWTSSWIGMAGLVIILHFGLFHLLSCAWRSVGVNARPLMNWPAGSRSLSEFWGVRWNSAFRDLAHRFLFRPLSPRVGAPAALIAGFLASGLVHDLVISLPAGGGYGGPTLYFLIQAAAILATGSAVGRRAGLRKGMVGRAFTVLVVIVPMPLLFHSIFVREVMVPFLRVIGAI